MHAAGPKLRKWYGEGERMLTDGGGLRDDSKSERPSQGEEDVLRTAILVTDADNPTAEQVVLQLILARYASRLSQPSTRECSCRSTLSWKMRGSCARPCAVVHMGSER